MTELNQTSFIILTSLRHREAARFSELQKPTGLESDSFKFYLRRLVQMGLVEKRSDGSYQLTAHGKEFANDLDERRAMLQKRPKLSAFLIVQRQVDGASQYLFQRRQRNPYINYWGVVSGPVHWGEATTAAADRELLKQTGLMADFTVTGFCRVRDYDASSHDLLEDKLFVVMHASIPGAEPSNHWHGGHNQWLTLAEFSAMPHRFMATEQIITAAAQGKTYAELDQLYEAGAY